MTWIPIYAQIPPQNGQTLGPARLASPGPLRIESVSFNHGYVDDDSAFGWVGIDLVEIRKGATRGEHVARYAKAYRQDGATAPMWAMVAENTDWSGKGPFCVIEVDAVSRGRDPNTFRRGVWVVLGKVRESPPEEGPAFFDAAYDIQALNFDQSQIDLRTGYKCSVPAEFAFEMLGGSALRLSEDPAVATLKFNVRSGYTGFWQGNYLIWGFNNTTKQIVDHVQF